MSMLNYFYNIKEKENAYLFNDLAISKDTDVMQHQNKYPVISITLKEMKQYSFVSELDLVFNIDISEINNGYPILSWQ